MVWERWARLLLAGVIIAGLCLGWAGCGGGGGGSSSSTRITGVIQDSQTLQPIKGATVKVGGSSTKTSADGTFELGVSPGDLSVAVSAPGYQSQTFTAVADKGQLSNIGVLKLLSGDNNPPPPPI